MMRLHGIGRQLAWLILAVIASAQAQAEGWYRGAVVLEKVQGEASMRQVGGDVVQLSTAKLPFYLPGLLQVESSEAATLRLKTSNGVPLFWSGPGYFAFERFDQFLTSNQSVEEISRLRLNLREGRLVMDSRAMAAASQLRVETPVGRVEPVEALWLLRIDHQTGSRMYQFTIACLAGSIRFVDRRNETYRLLPGQRLAGAGLASQPAIDVSEIDPAVREAVTGAGFSIDFKEEPVDLDAFMAQMKELPRREARLAEIFGAKSAAEDGEEPRRRFIIEYAPPVPERRPLGGRVRPPSEFESDLF